ncbi:hypothetical protein CEUSTIGMA_g1360.t1 [Chlamydomonas eustigma]|uniref:Uncharacterized protein n=1 Tax=Chlamydomonas eustigma TaxID=1157962 RepID=A0A250WTP4_9CHLO|nr:hypothetical protein CEUSTIGMA_g1360.t1 [Chlamydomonas eustigma]|eukprot:GAX73910.1 hypothetical protein CEUSTIGMA_g1360.t1 [Chlamydomonas eustigma]
MRILTRSVLFTDSCTPSSHIARYLPFRRPSIHKLIILNRRTQGGNNRNSKPKPSENKSSKGSSSKLTSRVADGALILGDAVMLIATEMSSERLLWDEEALYLVGTAVLSWFIAAAALGDYTGKPPSSENPFIQMFLGASFVSLLDATVTWAVAAILAASSYAVLVSQAVIDSSPLMEGLWTEDLSPQLEIAVASLITMSCWRGIATKMRY